MLWLLYAAYDPEAATWCTLHCDFPGLTTEAKPLERLRDRAIAVITELLTDDVHDIVPERRQGLHALRLVAFHESDTPVAA